MTREQQERLNEMAQGVYDFVFEMLDAELEISGMEAGRVATKAEKAFKESLKRILE